LVEEGLEVELILATGLTMEGEATALYIKSRLEKKGDEVAINRIGMGLPIGSDLSYVDEATLSRALESKRKL
jgi:recombination protein RecR